MTKSKTKVPTKKSNGIKPVVSRSVFNCDVCGVEDTGDGIGGWSVKTKLWNRVMFKYTKATTESGSAKGMLCMGCFEKRLRRKLKAKDFTATGDNHSNKNVQRIFKAEGYSKKAGWSSIWKFTSKDVWRD